jgi:hypothetical protein
MGIATILSFKAQGATRRVKRDDSTATHPIETFTTSSFKLRLKKADTEAMAKVIKEMISIVRLLPHGCLQLGRSFDQVRRTYFRLLTLFSLHNVEMNGKAICIS